MAPQLPGKAKPFFLWESQWVTEQQACFPVMETVMTFPLQCGSTQ